MQNNDPLTPAVLHILLALADEAQHGYAIMQSVAELSDGRVTMGPGTLYGSIKRMLTADLIVETDPPSEDVDSRRKYYQLTPQGRAALNAELVRLSRIVDFARDNQLLGDNSS